MSTLSRRSFLQNLVIGAGAVVIAPALIENVWEEVNGILQKRFYSIPATVKVSNIATGCQSAFEQRLQIIATSLDTPAQIVGAALDTPNAYFAQAMVDPIKTSLMYQAIGRKLLFVDELPQGALARYERDVAVKSYVIPNRETPKRAPKFVRVAV